jgi:hypothetical protein
VIYWLIYAPEARSVRWKMSTTWTCSKLATLTRSPVTARTIIHVSQGYKYPKLYVQRSYNLSQEKWAHRWSKFERPQ